MEHIAARLAATSQAGGRLSEPRRIRDKDHLSFVHLPISIICALRRPQAEAA
jgi:hypothetical protein